MELMFLNGNVHLVDEILYFPQKTTWPFWITPSGVVHGLTLCLGKVVEGIINLKKSNF